MTALVSLSLFSTLAEEPPPSPLAQTLAHTAALAQPPGDRLPLFFWTPNLPATEDDAALREQLSQLRDRGICLYHRWHGKPEVVLKTALRIGLMQKELGMPLAVDATGIAHGFFDGSEALSHLDADGKPFRDTSFFWRPGCPFAVAARIPEKRDLCRAFADAYAAAGLTVDYWAADWEFDGPNEWKDGWAAAKRCTRCRQEIPAIDTDFGAFQAAVRSIRTQLQHDAFVQPVRAVFPKVQIGNYAMNPSDGYRYYWDYYEEERTGVPQFVAGAPVKMLHGFTARAWADEFTASGYNVAMPVAYTWYNLYAGFEFEDRQYRWFYGMLKEVSSCAQAAARGVAVVPFVHWTTTNAPPELAADFEAMSEANYRELLWHALLRGIDSFAMWSPAAETAVEVQPVHQVYAESMAYSDFILQGEPITYTVPDAPGPVISGLLLGNRLLVRRTDFAAVAGAVTVQVGDRRIEVPVKAGACQVLTLK